jgi:hypothetical protein
MDWKVIFPFEKTAGGAVLALLSALFLRRKYRANNSSI